MTVKDEARKMIADFEGFRAQSYQCVAGQWTVGYGHCGPDVYPGLVITRERGEALLDSDMEKFSAGVRKMCPDATEHQHWAMVSLAFNIGLGDPTNPKVEGFFTSTVRRMHLAGNYAAAARAFGLWNKAIIDGRLQEVPGLIRRRAAEAAFYMTPDEAEKPLPMPQAVEPPKTVSKTAIAGSVSVAAGAVSVADQLDQVTPILDKVSQAGASIQSIAKLGALALSIVALAAVGYMLVRYVIKVRRGDVVVR